MNLLFKLINSTYKIIIKFNNRCPIEIFYFVYQWNMSGPKRKETDLFIYKIYLSYLILL